MREDRFTSSEYDAAMYETRRGLADDPDERPTLIEAERDEADDDGDQDTCRPVTVDGQVIRVHGAHQMTPEEVDALAELVRAAKHLLSLPDCPECWSGKHPNCRDVTWCDEHDDFAPCPCSKRGHKMVAS